MSHVIIRLSQETNHSLNHKPQTARVHYYTLGMCTYTNTHLCLNLYSCFIYIVRPPTIDSIMLNQGLDILQTAEFICSAAGYDVSYRWMVDST